MKEESVWFNCYETKFRKRKAKKIVLIVFLLFVFIISILFSYYKFVVSKIIIQIGQSKIEAMLTNSVNYAVSKTLSNGGIKYDDLVKIKTDIDGKISFITANSIKINELSNILALETQANLEKNSVLGFDIPLGTCSGISILNGKGKNINFSVYPVGNASCSFTTEFVQAGINQTNHKIYLNVSSKTTAVLPVSSKTFENNVQILISESVIVGEIPNVYLQLQENTKLLDLLP